MSGSYYEIFIKQFVQTLAQLSAAALTTSVAVPLYNFYIRRNSNTYEEVNQEDLEEDLEDDLEVINQEDDHNTNKERTEEDSSDDSSSEN
jgi:hypothetical protein